MLYTELYFRAKLRIDTPVEVIDVLTGMVSPKAYKVQKMPFGGKRAAYMFHCNSHFHHPFAMSRLDHLSEKASHYLLVRCDVLNDDNVVENFVEWIMPHVNASNGDYLGHIFPEMCRLPRPILMKNNPKRKANV